MIREDIRKIKSDPKSLRKFGITMAVALPLLAGLLVWRGAGTVVGLALVAIAVLFLALGLLRPGALKPIHKAWMALAAVLGGIMTWVILSVLFYVVVTPIGLLARASGKDFLDERFRKEATTYWRRRVQAPEDPGRYTRQY